MKRPVRSLQRRLLWLVLTVVTLGWTAAAALTWIDARHELDELLDGHLAQAAAMLLVQQSHELAEHEGALPDAPLLHRYAPKVAFQVFHDGRLLLRSANAPEQPMMRPANHHEGFGTTHVGNTAWRVFATRNPAGDIEVLVGEQRESRDEILAAIMRGALIPLILMLPLLGFAIWWAVTEGLVPLKHFGVALTRRQPDTLEPLAVRDAPAEMMPMIAALNGLFARIASLLESERRFTADAAHELRTPVAAIRAQAQVALQATDAPLRARALRNTMDGCDRAARVIDQLLTLARLESNALPAFDRCDLAQIVREVVQELAAGALEKGQTVAVLGDGQCLLRGDRTLLGVLVRNLVENAIRYSPAGGTIDLTLAKESDRVSLTVEDSGPGMRADEMAQLGNRFYRGSGHAESGSGLGWSIVNRIAKAHQLDIAVRQSEETGGLLVQIAGSAAD